MPALPIHRSRSLSTRVSSAATVSIPVRSSRPPTGCTAILLGRAPSSEKWVSTRSLPAPSLQYATPRRSADIIRVDASHLDILAAIAEMTAVSRRMLRALIHAIAGSAIAGASVAQGPSPAPSVAPAAVATLPGIPAGEDPANLYSDTTADKMSPTVADDPRRVYVPNLQSNDVYVIDQETMTVVDKFRVGLNPQHVVPSWDMRTLWVANNAENTKVGSLTPID